MTRTAALTQTRTTQPTGETAKPTSTWTIDPVTGRPVMTWTLR
jgi:hypothetical protein